MIPTFIDPMNPPPIPETTIDRRHDLDALRAVAMLLGIALHAALAYAVAVPWIIKDSNTHPFFNHLFSAVHGFRMPLFFMISGFFTAMLWRKRGLAALLRHRTKRILLPMVVFLVALIPISIVVFATIEAIDEQVNVRASPGDAENLWVAARDNDIASLKEFLETVEDIDAGDPQHQLPPLNWAALNGSTEAATLLIEEGADVNVRSGDQSTPLSHAAFTRQAELVNLLLSKDATINPVNDYQATPLDNVDAGWETVGWLSKTLGLSIEEERFSSDQEKVANLLRQNGGKHHGQLNGAESLELDQQESGGLAAIYLTIAQCPIFHMLEIFGHLWFLWFLCLLVLPFSVYAMACERFQWHAPPKWLFLSPLVFIWLVPLTMIPQWFHGLDGNSFGPDTSMALLPLPHILLLYAVFFFFGALYFEYDDHEGRLGRFWWISLPLALLVVYPVAHALVEDPGRVGWITDKIFKGKERILSVFLQALYAWLMTFGLIGLFRIVFRRENKLVRYVSDSSYWLYLAHIPLVFLAQALIRPLALPAFAKFTIVCLGLTAFLLITYDLLVRYTPLGTLLNGKKTRPGKKRDLEGQAATT
jgi:hypothetical protein